MDKIFLALYRFFARNRIIFFACLVAAFGVTGFFASKIKLEEDITAILPTQEKSQRLTRVFEHAGIFDKLTIMVSLSDSLDRNPDSLVAFARALDEKLTEQLDSFVEKSVGADEEQMLGLMAQVRENLPVYLQKGDYDRIDSLLKPGRLSQTLDQNYRTLTSPAGIVLKQMIAYDPVGITAPAMERLHQLQFDDNFELYDDFIISRKQDYLLVLLKPRFTPGNTGMNQQMLAGLDHILQDLKKEGFGHINARYFGSTAVSVENARQIRRDNLLTQGIALLFILAFMALIFRKKRAPFLLLLPVVFGALFSLAIVNFIQQKISVIALGMGSVVLGIAINYALHVFNHYRHTGSIPAVIKDLSQPMTIGGITTIGAFFCLLFVKTPLLNDMGLFAGFSLVGAALFSLIFLPHLIKSKKMEQQPHHENWIDRVSLWRPHHNKWLMVTILLLTLVFAYTSRWVVFEKDLMRMNYMPTALQQAEKQLQSIMGNSLQSGYLVSAGSNLEQALRHHERAVTRLDSLQANGRVQKFTSLSSIIVSDSLQKERINRWNAFWTTGKKDSLRKSLSSMGAQKGFSPAAFENFYALLEKNYSALPVAPAGYAGEGLASDYILTEAGETMVISLVKPVADAKPALAKAFEQDSNNLLADKQGLTNTLMEWVEKDFSGIAWMSGLLVLAVLLLTYGRIELALSTFLPMLITWVWILGIMGLAGIPFNLINIIISTLIFGLGDDYSIFIMDGLQQEYKTGKKLLGSYKSSILISAITTIVGLGVLIFAKHPALKSIALISIIGMVCVVLISQILIPFFFNFFIGGRVQKRLFPWTAFGLLKSAFAFLYFLTGCLLVFLAGLALIKLQVLGKKKGKDVYHVLISKFCWSLMYIMANVKKRVQNLSNERFDKPAVLIANHQSFLDILCAIMLHPKLVLLTNHWVWNSPFFGNVVRMAGYYPVREGAEQSIEPLRMAVADGYSIVVFPEGTRTVDGNMKRFHKGAFFLAEQLNIDLVPVVFHGTGYTMSKGDFLLKDGQITIRILPRITINDPAWGTGYANRTKKISPWFKTQYQLLKNECETPAYFAEQLRYNYLYKGPVLEWYQRIKVRLEKHYEAFNQWVPREGKVLDIGCGYGFLSYMLHFCSPNRQITGIDYDEEKVATANHCLSSHLNIHFNHADVLQFSFETYDAIILSDVLHYLPKEAQTEVLEKCTKHLSPNGLLIIRDGNAEFEHRHAGTKLSEFFSTRVFNFNKTNGKDLSFLKGEEIRSFAVAQNLQCTEIDHTRLTSNMVFLLKRKTDSETIG